MSRPSRDAEQRIEALEGAAGQIAEALQSCGILSVRLRQIWRQVPQLLPELEWARDELVRIVDACDSARSNLQNVLATEQDRRTEQNRGSNERTTRNVVG